MKKKVIALLKEGMKPKDIVKKLKCTENGMCNGKNIWDLCSLVSVMIASGALLSKFME